MKPSSKFKNLTEIHCHLDGSIRKATFLELYNNLPDAKKKHNYQDLHINYQTEKDISDNLCFKLGWDLPRCLESFLTTLLILQTQEALTRIAFELCEDLYLESEVRYAEIRYCPSLHRSEGLSDQQIVLAVAKGLSQASQQYQDAQFFQIITAVRELGVEEAEAMTRLAVQMGRPALIVGVDLAGNEGPHPPEKFTTAFEHAHKHGMKVTVHAGEHLGEENSLNQQAIKNIYTAVLQLHASRIGHGVAARLDPALLALLRERNVTVEICPTSNVQTGAIKSYSDHPVQLFLDEGVNVVVCCDNTLLSETDTLKEISLLQEHC